MSIRVLITLAAVLVAFRGRFTYDVSHKLTGLLGALLVVLGIGGVVSRSIAFALVEYVKPYDFLLSLELGIVFLLAAVSHRIGKRKFRFSYWISGGILKTRVYKLYPRGNSGLRAAKRL